MSKTLSIFCDESGDFGPYSKYSSFYIVGFVFHDQSIKIQEQLNKLKNSLKYQSYSIDKPIHALPLIRGENEYRYLSRHKRMQLLSSLAAFFRKCEIKTSTVLVSKKELSKSEGLEKQLSDRINELILSNIDYFAKYQKINLYYDSGQKKLTKFLNHALAQILAQ